MDLQNPITLRLVEEAAVYAAASYEVGHYSMYALGFSLGYSCEFVPSL